MDNRKFLCPDLVKTAELPILDGPLWDASKGGYYNPAKLSRATVERLEQETLRRRGR